MCHEFTLGAVESDTSENVVFHAVGAPAVPVRAGTDPFFVAAFAALRPEPVCVAIKGVAIKGSFLFRIGDISRSMRKEIPVLALLLMLLMLPSTFAQNNNSGASGGKITEDTAAPARKKSVPKPTPNQDNRGYSPCGVYYKNRADMPGESNLDDKWFSLGESANKHFWYNPHKTSCDAKTRVLKSWIKEDHKNTDSNYALVLYEFKCKPNQLRVKTVIEYDKTGGVLGTTNHDGNPWQDVAPGTAGVVILRTVCRRP